jgi:hypothetical protein
MSNTHTRSRECPACRGMCKFVQVNSLTPYEEIEAEMNRRRRMNQENDEENSEPVRFVKSYRMKGNEHPMYESWLLSTPWGWGWLATCDKRVVAGAPIFRKLTGWDLPKFPKNYTYEFVSTETEEIVRLLNI